MIKGVTPFFDIHVTNLQLCKTMPTSIALLTVLKKREMVTKLLSVCKVTFRLRGNRQGRKSIRMAVSALDVLTDR